MGRRQVIKNVLVKFLLERSVGLHHEPAELAIGCRFVDLERHIEKGSEIASSTQCATGPRTRRTATVGSGNSNAFSYCEYSDVNRVTTRRRKHFLA